MRLSSGEVHIYAGLAIAALGLGLALGVGWGLLLAGTGLIPLGVILSATEAEEPQRSKQMDQSALMTAAPEPDEEAA